MGGREDRRTQARGRRPPVYGTPGCRQRPKLPARLQEFKADFKKLARHPAATEVTAQGRRVSIVFTTDSRTGARGSSAGRTTRHLPALQTHPLARDEVARGWTGISRKVVGQSTGPDGRGDAELNARVDLDRRRPRAGAARTSRRPAGESRRGIGNCPIASHGRAGTRLVT